MSKSCPIFGVAIYADCLDCDTKYCRGNMYNTIIIGIDQSYENTGVSISADGVLKKVGSINLSKYSTNSDKRTVLRNKLTNIVSCNISKAKEVICIIERIRLRSQGFLNINYIKSIGALNSVIVDVMADFGIEVYSVDTRCWKAQVIGTSKPKQNGCGVPPEKWPTVEWCINMGFESSILREVKSKRKLKGTFMMGDIKYSYNHDASDSAAISMFYFKGDRTKLKEEV